MRRRYHLGLPFWVYCGLTLLVALAAMNRNDNLLYWVFGVMASSLLVSGLVSGLMMTGLSVRRVSPPHGMVGEALTIRYAVRNRNRLFPVFNIHLEERPVSDRRGWQQLMSRAAAWVMHIGPREEVHGEALFWPRRRGEARFHQLRIWTSFPFGIIRKSLILSCEHHTLVYPRLYALRPRVLEAIAPAAAIGAKVSHHAGAGDDYFGLREFRPGDSMRHIAWKRLANREELVTIERTRPTPPKMRLVLNLSSPPATDGEGEASDTGRQLEEEAISLAASIIHAADLTGCEVGLTILGLNRDPIPVRRSHWHRNRLMAALAEIDLGATRSAEEDRGPADVDRVGLIVVHPDRVDPTVVTGEAWHFTSRQMHHLVDEPIGWGEAPSPEPVGEGATARAAGEEVAA
ncbi:MAG: DUF58 domain-containing protein [Planctomycetota bacterium]|nr:DUF58 domain-containing protein [Planctomycetota bacterium]